MVLWNHSAVWLGTFTRLSHAALLSCQQYLNASRKWPVSIRVQSHSLVKSCFPASEYTSPVKSLHGKPARKLSFGFFASNRKFLKDSPGILYWTGKEYLCHWVCDVPAVASPDPHYSTPLLLNPKQQRLACIGEHFLLLFWLSQLQWLQWEALLLFLLKVVQWRYGNILRRRVTQFFSGHLVHRAYTGGRSLPTTWESFASMPVTSLSVPLAARCYAAGVMWTRYNVSQL